MRTHVLGAQSFFSFFAYVCIGQISYQQHMVLASRASGCLFGHPNPWKEPLRTPKSFSVEFLKKLNLKLIIKFFHLLIIPMTLFNDIMPYFDKLIHVYGWNRSIFWSPLKIWTPKKFSTTNFRHPVSKSWLRHCSSIRVKWYPALSQQVVERYQRLLSFWPPSFGIPARALVVIEDDDMSQTPLDIIVFWIPKPPKITSGHPNCLGSNFLKCQLQTYNWSCSTSI